jgi:DNA-binding winged helix-turn-helix (wHTH) protein/TolB-like protein
MALVTQRLFRFGTFRLDPEMRLLFRGDTPLPLRPRVFDTLLLLVERRGTLVTKEELLEAVWPDTVVEENNLNQNILALRRVLETEGTGGVRIETVPRRGYRLIAPAAEEAAPTPLDARPALESAPSAVAGPATGAPPSRRRLVIAGVAACAVALATGWVWRLTHTPRPISGIRSIAVLPLRSLGSGGDEFLGLGLADAVITRLGYVRALSVRPTSSVRALPDAGADPVAAGRTLRVDAVLDGQIQKSGERVRVTVQLIGVREGSTLWSEKFDVKAADLFTVEDSISEAVTRALVSSLSAGEAQRVGRDRPTTPEAYRVYLEGRYFWNQRTEASSRKARELFERAIALDPNYALAYAGLADSLTHASGASPREKRQAAEKALSLDDSLAEAHTSLGNTILFSEWNAAQAEKSFRRALDLNPSYATAHQWYAYCFLVRGDLAGALKETRLAQQADPLSPSIGVDLGLMFYYMRRYDDAIVELRRVLELAPGFGQALQSLQLVLLKKGDVSAAARECSPVSGTDPELTNTCLALVAAHAGDRSEAEAWLKRSRLPVRWFVEVQVAVPAGQRDRAVAALEEGYRLHDPSLLLIGADPLLDDLRADPRFLRLLQKIGVTLVPAA